MSVPFTYICPICPDLSFPEYKPIEKHLLEVHHQKLRYARAPITEYNPTPEEIEQQRAAFNSRTFIPDTPDSPDPIPEQIVVSYAMDPLTPEEVASLMKKFAALESQADRSQTKPTTSGNRVEVDDAAILQEINPGPTPSPVFNLNLEEIPLPSAPFELHIMHKDPSSHPFGLNIIVPSQMALEEIFLPPISSEDQIANEEPKEAPQPPIALTLNEEPTQAMDKNRKRLMKKEISQIPLPPEPIISSQVLRLLEDEYKRNKTMHACEYENCCDLGHCLDATGSCTFCNGNHCDCRCITVLDMNSRKRLYSILENSSPSAPEMSDPCRYCYENHSSTTCASEIHIISLRRQAHERKPFPMNDRIIFLKNKRQQKLNKAIQKELAIKRAKKEQLPSTSLN